MLQNTSPGVQGEEKETRIRSIIGFLSLLALAAAMADLYVPADFDTIQEAIDAATPGETIHVAAGIYNTSTETFPLTIDRTLHLLGTQAGTDPRPSTGGRTGGETILDAEEASAAVIVIAAAAGVEINGFAITGGTGDMVEESGHDARRMFSRLARESAEASRTQESP